MVRVVGHVDLDYFYAQVEEVEDPSIKSKPVLVCVYSGRTEDSGVVSTANYRARELGVRSGVPIATAKKKLEGLDAVFIRMVHEKYEAVSERIMQLVREEVDILEQSGIDEAYFDITRSTAGDFSAAKSAAEKLKQSILSSEGLTSSVGLGQSKVVAKIASDYAKPNGLTVVLPQSTGSFLGPLPVTKLSGVGPKSAEILERLRVMTIGELAGKDVLELEKHFGKKTAVYLHEAANGSDLEPVAGNQSVTQLSRIITLRRNTRDCQEALSELAPAIESLRAKLVASQTSFRTVSAIGIFSDLSSKTKSRTLENPTQEPNVISGQARNLFEELLKSNGKELRRVGIRVSDLSSMQDQTSLTQFSQGAQLSQ